jgi:hypothetical protein
MGTVKRKISKFNGCKSIFMQGPIMDHDVSDKPIRATLQIVLQLGTFRRHSTLPRLVSLRKCPAPKIDL